MARLLFLAAFLLLFAAQDAAALKISPFKVSLQAEAAQGASQVFRVENNTGEPAAVEIRVETWDIAEDGQEHNRSAEDDFMVFPAQLVLAAGESRAVRVQWLGGEMPVREKAFRLVAEQLPVNLQGTPAAGSAVRFLVRFKAALYLRPPQAESDIAVDRVAATAEGHVSLRLHNRGTAHSLLRQTRVTLLHADGRETVVPESALSAIEGENIHAGAARRFVIPVSAKGVTGARLVYAPSF